MNSVGRESAYANVIPTEGKSGAGTAATSK